MENIFIAAIAGSAGAHNSVLDFFDHTPHDDVSFVILRYLPNEPNAGTCRQSSTPMWNV